MSRVLGVLGLVAVAGCSCGNGATQSTSTGTGTGSNTTGGGASTTGGTVDCGGRVNGIYCGQNWGLDPDWEFSCTSNVRMFVGPCPFNCQDGTGCLCTFDGGLCSPTTSGTTTTTSTGTTTGGVTTTGTSTSGGTTGSVVATVTDIFYQPASIPPIDLLFVVDNSLAMGPFQAAIGANVQLMFDQLNALGVDYQIAVTSGDPLGYQLDGGVRGQFSALGGTAIITPSTPDAGFILSQNLQLGSLGSDQQLPVFTALEALGLLKWQQGTPPSGNAGFIRSGARLAIVFITDGDDRSAYMLPKSHEVFDEVNEAIATLTLGVIDAGTSWLGTYQYTDFVEALRNLKGPGNLGDVFLQGILWDGSNPLVLYLSPLHGARAPATTLCGPPDGTQDQQIGYALEYLLTAVPFPAAIASLCADAGSNLLVTTYGAEGLQTSFSLKGWDATVTLACDGGAGPVCVWVNGQPVPPTWFSLVGSSDSLVFDDSYVPKLGDVITAVYTPSPLTLACQSPSDCGAGYACHQGTCNPACAQTSECASGFVCGSNHTCNCQEQAACQARPTSILAQLFSFGLSPFCGDGGDCQVGPCLLNSDCPIGQQCEATLQVCVPIGVCDQAGALPAAFFSFPLVASFDCDAGSACLALPDDGGFGTCVPGCSGDFDCPSGQDCSATNSFAQYPGTCAPGCVRTEDCCIGQVCSGGKCLLTTNVAGLSMCDLASCAGANPSLTQCEDAGGLCEEVDDLQFGCVPFETSDGPCAKGYVWETPLYIESPCTLNGNQCTGGRTCSATLEAPNGTCSCMSQGDCPTAGICSNALDAGFYCYAAGPTCGPALGCDVLAGSVGTVCDDAF